MIPHILAVEDDRFFRELLREHFSTLGYAFELAASGREALERLRQESFHILLTDLEMPDLCGDDLVEIVHREYPALVCMALSAHGDSRRIVSVLNKFKAFDFIFKPFKLDDIRVAVERAFEYYELKRKAETFSESEKRFHRLLMETFDWKQELRNRSVHSIARNVINQLNIGFFHGGGMGTLLSAMSMVFKRSKQNPGNGCFEVPEPLMEMLRENYSLAMTAVEGISRSQSIFEERRPVTDRSPVRDIHQDIELCREEVEPLLEIKKQRLVMGSLPDAAARGDVIYNRDMMRTVFKELFINAMKYSANGDSLFGLMMLKDNHLEIKFLNPAYPHNGSEPGIHGPNETLIFEPFFRLSSVMDERYSSMEEFSHGLGLPVVKKILELHRASIFVHTIKNHAAMEREYDVCVTIRLPLVNTLEPRFKNGLR